MHPPSTIAGVLIHARALAGYADVDKDGLKACAPVKAATILGRGLADAVLRVAGVKAYIINRAAAWAAALFREPP